MLSPLIVTPLKNQQTLSHNTDMCTVNTLTPCESLEMSQESLMRLEAKVDVIYTALLSAIERLPKKRSRRCYIKKDSTTTANQSEISEPGTPISERINPKAYKKLV